MVASTVKSPRSANHFRCDRLPFSRQLRRFICSTELSQGVKSFGKRHGILGYGREEHRFVWLQYRMEAHDHPKRIPITFPLPPRTTPPSLADDNAPMMEGGGGVNRLRGAQVLLQRVVAVQQKAQYPSAPHTWRTGLHHTGMEMLSLQACLREDE